MVNLGSSVFRREKRSTDEVIRELKAGGWREVDSVGNRLFYLENSGFSLTVIDGPLGTVVMPSGPIRGRLFGSSGIEIGGGNLMEMGRERLGSRMSRSNNSSSGSSSSSSAEASGEPEQPGRKNARTSGAGDFV